MLGIRNGKLSVAFDNYRVPEHHSKLPFNYVPVVWLLKTKLVSVACIPLSESLPYVQINSQKAKTTPPPGLYNLAQTTGMPGPKKLKFLRMALTELSNTGT